MWYAWQDDEHQLYGRVHRGRAEVVGRIVAAGTHRGRPNNTSPGFVDFSSTTTAIKMLAPLRYTQPFKYIDEPLQHYLVRFHRR